MVCRPGSYCQAGEAPAPAGAAGAAGWAAAGAGAARWSQVVARWHTSAPVNGALLYPPPGQRTPPAALPTALLLGGAGIGGAPHRQEAEL